MAQAAAIQATLINNYFTPLPAGASQPFIGGTEAAAATASALNPYPFFNSVYQTNIPAATGEITIITKQGTFHFTIYVNIRNFTYI